MIIKIHTKQVKTLDNCHLLDFFLIDLNQLVTLQCVGTPVLHLSPCTHIHDRKRH